MSDSYWPSEPLTEQDLARLPGGADVHECATCIACCDATIRLHRDYFKQHRELDDLRTRVLAEVERLHEIAGALETTNALRGRQVLYSANRIKAAL